MTGSSLFAAAAAAAAGSLMYMSPEVFREQPYSEKVSLAHHAASIAKPRWCCHA
jgi:hypothetical protein